MVSDVLAAGAWQRLSGHTLLFPVIGNPVTQVRAPAVFNALFAQAGIDAVSFGLALPADSVATTCRALLASPNVGGLLVTVPYKRVLTAIASRLGPDAATAGSANALRRGADGRIEAELFDGTGFLRGLRAAGHDPAGRRVLLLGTGGAGAAIAAKLGEAGVAELRLFDVNPQAAEAVASSLRRHYPRTVFLPQADTDPADCDIAINATPAGLRPGDPLPMDLAALAEGTLVCDIIMEPAVTPLLAAAAARGLPVHPGRAMLDHQAAAYLHYFGLDDLAARVGVEAEGVVLR